MWIVAIAWMYVALMMAVAEATASNGTVLGAVITLLLYGIAPTSLVMYLLTTPVRRRARRAAEAQARTEPVDPPDDAVGPPGDSVPPQPDHRSLTAGDGLASKRIEP